MKLIRQTIELTNNAMGRARRNQRVAIKAPGLVKLNLGCGLSVAPGWINIDGSLNALVATLPAFVHGLAYRASGAHAYYSEEVYRGLLRDHRFVHHDLAFGIPLHDGVVDFVYSSHFVEHLFRQDAAHLLKEIHRVLKPGGRVRIAIPDLEYAISLYGKGRKDEMLSSFFFVESKDSYYSRHKYMYDYEMIATALERSGLRDIRRCSYREGLAPDIEILDKYPDESLFVEATR